MNGQSTYREITAAFPSACGACPYGIQPGERICTTGAGWHHVDCAVTVSKRTGPAPVPAAPKVPESGLDISGLDGHYAVETPRGLTFLRVDAPTKDKWAGWRFAKVQSGGNYDRLGSQKPGGTYRGQAADLISLAVIDPDAAMRRYGRELGHCGRCNRELTDAESRAYGIGPECRKAMAA